MVSGEDERPVVVALAGRLHGGDVVRRSDRAEPPPRPTRTARRIPDVGRWPRLISRSASAVAREVVAAAAAVGGPSPLDRGTEHGDADPQHPAPLHGRRPAALPVILVHGFGATPACWFALRRALRAEGRTVVSFGYSPWAASVEELADRLTTTVDDLLATTGAPQVHLIGHSLGGVIIAQALICDQLAGRVDLVATLGSPFGGSPWAALCPLGPPLVRALRAGSPLLRGLAGAPPPAGVRWLAFTSPLDPVVPGERAVPVNRPATRVDIDAAGHSAMLLDREVIARIVAMTAVPPNAADPGDLLVG